MALYAKAGLEENATCSAAQRAVASVGGEVWQKSGRGERERQVERAFRPTWVEAATVKRTARLVLLLEECDPDGIDLEQGARLGAFICRLSPAWASTACRMYLNLRTTSNRLHDRERDRCYLGCGVDDSLSHYAHCMPLRFITDIFDDVSARHDSAGEFYGIGLAASCPDVPGAIRRNVLVCLAYHAVRARRRDEGVPTAAEA